MQDPKPIQSSNAAAQQIPEQQEQHLKCPRCDSTNTKFCYFNNYNLSQPRHYCKSCRRYWTKGGALRNIPVGGGSRKNSKRVAASSKRLATSSPSNAKPEPVSFACPAIDSDYELLDMNGSFSSLLASNGQFKNFMESSADSTGTEKPMQEPPMMDNFLGLRGDSGSWDAGWSDLVIYNLGLSFD